MTMRRPILTTLLALVLTAPMHAGVVIPFGCPPFEDKLTASDAAGGDQFGHSAAVDGQWLVVGAWGDNNPNGIDAGAVYVFRNTGSGWSQFQKLIASDGSPGDLFGAAVDVSGSRIIIGAPGDDPPGICPVGGCNRGAAYFFRFQDGAWSEHQKVVPAGALNGDEYGRSVAIDGAQALVGSPLPDTGCFLTTCPADGCADTEVSCTTSLDGRVCSYFLALGTWGSTGCWTAASFSTSPGDAQFGADIALDSSAGLRVFGAPNSLACPCGSTADRGQIMVDAPGTTSVVEFGTFGDIQWGDRVAVQDPWVMAIGSDQAYFLLPDGSGWNLFSTATSLHIPTGGGDIALGGTIAAYRATLSSVGVINHPDWTALITLSPAGLLDTDGYGRRIDTDGMTLVVAAEDDDGDGMNTGAVYVYDFAPPCNDSCTDPVTVVSGLPVSFTNLAATTGGDEEDDCFDDGQIHRDVWFRHVATCDGVMTVSTCNDADFDTRLVAYEEHPVSGGLCPGPFQGGVLISCADIAFGCGGGTTALTVDVSAGSEYLIRVGGASDDAYGFGSLTVTCSVPGDECDDPLPISLGSTSFSTIGATTDGPQGEGCDVHDDIWFEFVSPCGGELVISTCEDIDFVTNIAVYAAHPATGELCPGPTPGGGGSTFLACDEPATLECLIGSLVLVDVVQGNRYAIRVGGQADDFQGGGTITLNCQLPPRVCTGKVIFVNQAVGSGVHDGESWATAYASLTQAINSCDEFDNTEIWVAAGHYKPTEGSNREAAFNLHNGLAIYGGFAGDETSREQRDWQANPTSLDGGIGDPDDATDNSFNVVRGTGTDSTAILDGFVIKNGFANQVSFEFPPPPLLNRGGGLFEGGASVSNCYFINNFALAAGGAIYSLDGPRLSYITFINNTAGPMGGGGGGGGGGGSSLGSGGAVFFASPPPGPFGAGGGLFNCLLLGNQARNGGGAFIESGPCAIINTTIASNLAANPGTNPAEGGGLYVAADAEATIRNTILWNNADDGGVDLTAQRFLEPGADLAADHSCIQGLISLANGNINQNPQFLDLDGADSVAGTPDDDLHLAADSPCIDAGNNSGVGPMSGLLVDLEGDPRKIDDPATVDTGVGTPPIVDMGADEFQPGAKRDCPADLNDSGDVTGLDLAILLGAWTGATSYAPCPPFDSADLNGDCRVNGLDLALLLGAWGPCR